VAIADERPDAQPLRAEFELFRRLFERAGVSAEVCDPAELTRTPHGLALRGSPLDLVYLRYTDWQLAAPRSRALREAYLGGDTVATRRPGAPPAADKRRLRCSRRRPPARARRAAADAALLAEVLETRLLAELAGAVWRAQDWVFKPATAFGSRAVYRGDKISRRRFDEVLAVPGYVAQRRVAPGEISVDTSDGPQRMKFDVRAYAYRDEILLLGARAYQGQVTNLRSPGGGFSAICVSRR
jgi:hypothetical protein